MPRKTRLTRQDFNTISPRGTRRLHGGLFSVSVARHAGQSGAKAAVVVSKKAAPKAVARNLLRRRCREVIRPLLSSIETPSMLVFYAKRTAAQASFAAIRRDIAALMAQMR